MTDLFVYVVAAFFFGMGLVALFNPPAITRFLSLPSIPSDMRNEVRAVYGGFGVAMSAVLVTATRVDSIRAGVLVTVSLALFGMAGGRLVSLTVERPDGRYPYVFLAFELIAGGALAYVWYATGPKG